MILKDPSGPDMQIVVPDFLILGAAKSGTTSLYFYLRQHPNLFLPEDVKEPGYLAFAHRDPELGNPAAPHLNIWNSVIFNREDYLHLFAGAKSAQKIGEATPEYLYLYADTIQNIKQFYGSRASELKFVAILRNPIDRLWSHYWMCIRDGYESLPFDEAIAEKTIQSRLASGWHPSYDYVGFGRYAEQIGAWQQAFGVDALKVVLFDELKSSASLLCERLYNFIGVPAGQPPQTEIVFNKSGKLRHEWLHEYLFRRESSIKKVVRAFVPYKNLQAIKHRLLIWNTEPVPMPPEIRIQLLNLYKADIEKLALMLGRDLSGWLHARAPTPIKHSLDSLTSL